MKMGVRYGGGALTRLKWLIHVLMLQWLWSWFALILCLSDVYSAYLPHDVHIIQYLRRRVVNAAAVQIRAQYLSNLKTVGRAETFESWPSENGVNSK